MYNQGYPPQNNGQQSPLGYAQYVQYPQNGSPWYPPMPGGVPQEQPLSPFQASKRGGGARGNKPNKRKSIKWQLVKLLILILVLAGAVAGGYVIKVTADVRPYVKTFLDNISVDGIPLGGKTWEEGSREVWAQAQAKQNRWYVRLKNSAGESKDITAETLGITFDPSAALEKAWAIGHDTSRTHRKTIFELQQEIAAMKNSSAEFFSFQQSANTAPIDSILGLLQKRAYTAPQDAAIIGFDPDNTKNPFTFQREVWGKELDTAAIKEQILEMVQTFQSGEIMLEPRPLAPKVTVADLQKSVAQRARAVTPIDKHSTNERNENIRVAFSKLNGKILKDGEKLSFNKVVGRRTQKNGFYQAFEYNYGELVPGWGGGVCQASTTVYLAVAQAGLTIVDRTAHGTPVSYTEKGKDATVSDTRGREIDFVFRNNTGSNIYLAAHVISDPSNKNRLLCEVRIYGQDLGNVRYALETEIVKKVPMPMEPEYIQDTTGKYATVPGEEITVIEASEGYVVDSFLCTIVDGVQTERKKIDRDTYPARPARIYVGVFRE
ncbi:MAG: hypothetical protein GXY67_08200 [Clostridiales bacterium]|nr:hypothetical protein [Clostridiales bacterium]